VDHPAPHVALVPLVSTAMNLGPAIMKEEYAEPATHIYERPYGRQERLTLNTASTVKFISINPGHEVSLHRHQKRDEWWTILDGPLDVEIDGRAWTATSGQRIWIPRGVTHRIGNSGRMPRQFLELALGFFDEDDIERLPMKHHAPGRPCERRTAEEHVTDTWRGVPTGTMYRAEGRECQ
jgi:mannose-6-phosphate isomerase